MNGILKRTSPIVLLIGLGAFGAPAQTFPPPTATDRIDDNFQIGWHEVSLGLGVLFPNTVRRGDRPNINYVLESVEAGYMVNAPGNGGIFRGNFELVPQLFGAEIYGGPGNYIVGAALSLRYNFVPKESRFVPYLQFGGGGTALDIPHRFDGKSFNFNIDAEVGLHYFIQPKCALNAEYMFQHISNADLWDRNAGVNTSGPVFGVSFFF